jgi:hypothetical protein
VAEAYGRGGDRRAGTLTGGEILARLFRLDRGRARRGSGPSRSGVACSILQTEVTPRMMAFQAGQG